jgi:NAD(P)-dependent dehydrogenase (short-subunit alcohol dehydrogenase family)
MDIRDPKVVVVGAGSGIGLGIALLAAEIGMRVVAVGRTRSKLEAIGPRVSVEVADVTREEEVERLFAGVGAFDHLVVTAQDLHYESIASLAFEDARRGIDSKLTAALLLAKHAVKRIARDGSITFTAGIASDRPMTRAAVVASSNAALEGLTRALAVELGPVRVNVLSPGWVDTPVWDRLSPDKAAAFATMSARLPVGRVGTPADIAHAARFLMENGFVTGTVLHVDGGHHLV